MISSDIIRGYNDTFILFHLLDGPSYGYEISKHIRERSGDKYSIKETTLYSAFTRLERNDYRITESGRIYYKEKCEEWKVTKEVVEQFIRL